MKRRYTKQVPLAITEDCDISFLGKHVKSGYAEFPKYFVYAWRRNDIYLYIGQSANGETRFIQHSIIKFIDGDYLDIWICPDRKIALIQEEEFIKYYKPIYNKTHNSNIKLVRKDVVIPTEELVQCKSKKEFVELRKKYVK